MRAPPPPVVHPDHALHQGPYARGAEVLMRATRARQLAPQHQTAGVLSNPPVVTYEQLAQVDRSMRELDRNIDQYVSNVDFLRDWKADYAEFRKFADPLLATISWDKFAQMWRADEYAQRTEDWARRSRNWRAAYANQKTAAGDDVPPLNPALDPPSRGEVIDQREEAKDNAPSLLPWWAWLLGGAALVGAGYMFYRTYKSQKADLARKQELLENMVPHLLTRGAADRDPLRWDASRLAGGEGDLSSLGATMRDRTYVTGLSVRSQDLPEILKLAARK